MDSEQWSKSLIFPMLATFVSVFVFCLGFEVAPLSTIIGLLCGILPFFLTILFKVDTSEVITHKLKYSLICLGGLFFVQAGTGFNIFVISVFYIFDLLYLNTYDLPLLNRFVAASANPTFLLLSILVELFNDLSGPFYL